MKVGSYSLIERDIKRNSKAPPMLPSANILEVLRWDGTEILKFVLGIGEISANFWATESPQGICFMQQNMEPRCIQMNSCVRKGKGGLPHLGDALNLQPGSAIHPSLLAAHAPATGPPFSEICLFIVGTT
jgi:hypothetical protein